ncbi:MAG: right-handed parallel beta-helix repeat-containing protein, partial [Actinobacteria bacterium]|nr:right-handed parallel beta-helix repeat-containing protein [Actinomycetota bacterium]
MAVDSAGNLFISDVDNNRIRRVDAVTHVITTVAGNGSSASSGDGGPATAAGFNPRGIAFDPAGNLYIVDVVVGRIRKVLPGPDGLVNGGPGETISTYVGGGTLLLDPANEGKPALQFSLPDSNAFPEGITFDSAGNLYVTLVGSPRVIKVAVAGSHALTTVAGNGTPARLGPSGDGGPATAAMLDFPYGVTVDPAGNLYIADGDARRVRRVDHATHIITTIAGVGQLSDIGAFGTYGDGGPGTAAPLGFPADVTFRSGSTYFVDRSTGLVRRVDANGIITTYAGGGVNDGGPATAAVLNHPRGLDTDAAGNLYIADCGNGRVRKVTPAGVISTVAGGGEQLNTGPAVNVALGCPSDVAVVKSGPAAGTIYIADSADNRIRKVAPDGTISTVVGTGVAGFSGDGGAATLARLNNPQGVNLAPNGDLLIADTGNNRVRRVAVATGKISTVAGNGAFGPGSDGVQATSTTVVGPTDVTVDGAGNLIIAESGFNRIRMVTPAGIISTIAGNGIPGFSGDGGPARSATLSAPTQLQFDAVGNLLFTDRGNGRVRQIAAGPPPPPPAMGCGAVITVTTTLSADVGPCVGDGLVIGADNITLNLNGHTISGAGPGDGSNAGIRLPNRRGVRISGTAGSTVQGFSAGVAIIGGAGNRVSGLTIRDNVGPITDEAIFGDGIGVFFSASNTIIDNTITHNGIYDGIGILGLLSDNNRVLNNRISDTTDGGVATQAGTGNGVIVNAFLSTDFPRERSVFRNTVSGNVIETSDNSGVANI